MSYENEQKDSVTLSQIRYVSGEEAKLHLNGQSNSARVVLQIYGEEIGRNWLKPGERQSLLERLFTSVRDATQRVIGENGITDSEQKKLETGVKQFTTNGWVRLTELANI